MNLRHLYKLLGSQPYRDYATTTGAVVGLTASFRYTDNFLRMTGPLVFRSETERTLCERGYITPYPYSLLPAFQMSCMILGGALGSVYQVSVPIFVAGWAIKKYIKN